jgi:hypothetical protein
MADNFARNKFKVNFDEYVGTTPFFGDALSAINAFFSYAF